jgi:hypothetical protein
MIYTDGTIPVKPGTILTREYWLVQAKGVRDSYGNPFRVVTLRWNWSSINKIAPNVKTGGFEDAIISRSRTTGGLSIRYRYPGSVVWRRPIGGVGDFMAECPITPKNMKVLASCIPNEKWFIVDDDIRSIAEKMYEKKVEVMDENTKKFNKEWFTLMKSLPNNQNLNGGNVFEDTKAKVKTIEDKNLELARKEQELSLKSAALDIKEQELINAKVVAVSEGKDIIIYQDDALKGMKRQQLMHICKQIGVSDNVLDKKIPELIQLITEKQSHGNENSLEN